MHPVLCISPVESDIYNALVVLIHCLVADQSK